MADEVRQPVAIRITRPYSNEDEFLAQEIDTLTRTSVTLIGAQSRPPGVILRFEVILLDGSPLMRGEGRVIAFKGNALGNLPGLTLRFTRLDKKTKGLVDRAALIREDRARAALRASMESELPPPPSEPREFPRRAAPAGRDPAPETSPSSDRSSESALHTNGHVPSPPAPPAERIIYRAAERDLPSQETPAAPRDRDSLLLRLRERARGLAPETVASILHDLPTSSQD